jgi:glyoxylase-like metal-dependent hydrolase (beta-lactamase superfamily II)
MKIRSLFLCVGLCLSISVSKAEQAQDFGASDLGDGLVLLQGRGGNVLLSQGEQGLLLVDDDYADMSQSLIVQLDLYGGLERLKYIINTHWHGDHTGGNEALARTASVVAHNNVRERLSSRQELAFFQSVSEPVASHALPSLTYPDRMNIHFNGQSWQLQHYPRGHTDGDTVVFLQPANLVHMGDHLFYPMFPFVDVGSGGNVVSFTANVGDVLERIDDNTRVVPGHGQVTDKAGLASYHQMLLGTLAEVKVLKSQGMSLQQAQKHGLSAQWETWGGGFIKPSDWINFIYQSLD